MNIHMYMCIFGIFTGSCYLVQAGFYLMTYLPAPPPECWDNRYEPTWLAMKKH